MAAVVTIVTPARADNDKTADKAAAQRLYTEGKKLYDIGEYQRALDAFKRAYLAYEEPTFLFNVGHCYRALGNAQEAIRFYRSYLRNEPAAANVAEVERIVHQLEHEQAEKRHADETQKAATPAATPTPTPTPALTATAAPPPKKRSHLWVLPVVGGVVAAGLAVGLGVGLTVGRPSEPSLTPVQY